MERRFKSKNLKYDQKPYWMTLFLQLEIASHRQNSPYKIQPKNFVDEFLKSAEEEQALIFTGTLVMIGFCLPRNRIDYIR